MAFEFFKRVVSREEEIGPEFIEIDTGAEKNESKIEITYSKRLRKRS